MRPVILLVSGILAADSLLASAAFSQNRVALVANVMGTVEVQRAGAGWETAAVGTEVFVSDTVRTATGSGARIIFEDDSLVDLGPETRAAVGRFTLEPDLGRRISLLYLKEGKLHALVGGGYQAAKSRYEIETTSAVMAAQDGEFIVLFDARSGATEVITVDGTAGVEATLGVIGPRVTVERQQMCRIPKGRYPEAARRMDSESLARHRAAFVKPSDTADTVVSAHPALAARILRPEDIPSARGQKAAAPSAGTDRAVSAPEDTLPERLSPAVRAQKQPLQDYRLMPPERRGQDTSAGEFLRK